MKKIYDKVLFVSKINLRFLTISVLLFLTVGSQAFAQIDKKVTINVQNVTVRAVLDKLTKDTQIHFMYEEETISSTLKVSLAYENTALSIVLDDLCKQAALRYETRRNIILLYPKAATQVNQRDTPIEITGVVFDENGLELTGANVLEVGTTNGVITDLDGKYMIKVTPGSFLSFSFMGMVEQVVSVKKDSKIINIHMEPTSVDLSDVIVTGYAQTTMRKMTGSVGVINASEIKNKPQPNIDAVLQGQVAGVNVSAVTGQPGKSQKIRIRGTSTISGDADPLWVIDGVPMQNADAFKDASNQIKVNNFDDVFTTGIAGINPNDIENIYILKDASATAIYGSRGANGVIVLTTKKGSKGSKVRVSYSGNMSVTMSPEKDAKLMNSAEKIEFEEGLWNEFSKNKYEASGFYPVVGIVGMVRSGNGDSFYNLDKQNPFKGMSIAEQDAYLESLKGVETDWYDELFRNGISTGHHVSISGGSEIFSFFSSLGYNKESGLLKGNDYDRYNFRLNLDVTPSSKLKVSLGVDLAYNYSKSPALSSINPFNYAYFANPYETPYNEDGSYRADETYYALEEYNNFSKKSITPSTPKVGFNIMREMNETSSKNKRTSTSLRGGLDYKLTDKIKLEGLLSYTYSSNRIDEIYGAETLAALRNRMSAHDKMTIEYASILQSVTNNDSYLARAQASYNDTFGEIHSLSVYGGAELRGSENKSLVSKRFGYDPITGNNSIPLPTPSEDNTVGMGTVERYINDLNQSAGQSITESRFASFYAAIDYYLKNRYIFNVSYRADGFSNFGSDEQFNPTWSTGFSWHAGDEKFLDFLKPTLDWMTFRTSFGYTGNVVSTSVVSPQIVLSYFDEYRHFGGQSYRTGRVSGAPNPHLRWEKTKDMKASLDVGLFDGRLSGLFEAYYRKSTDLVESVRVLSSTGFTNQKYNALSLENKGIELTIKAVPVKTKDFNLDMSVNFALNRNKVTDFKSTNKDMGTNELWEGYPVGAIFSGKYDGIDPFTGLYSFKLRPDAKITSSSDLGKSENYRYYLGTNEAPYVGGLSLSASYKSFRLSVYGAYSLGAKKFENITPPVSYTSTPEGGTALSSIQTSMNDVYRYFVNARRDAFDRWTVDNPNGKYPRVYNAYEDLYDIDGNIIDNDYYPTGFEIIQSVFLEKLSYLRIKNIILGYSLPKKFVTNLGVSSVAASLSLNNFFTFTNYSGMDPEVPGATYPISRSVTFTLNIDF